MKRTVLCLSAAISFASLIGSATAAELTGNFSALSTIYDPTTQQPFPGNQIPTSRFDPASQGVRLTGFMEQEQGSRPGSGQIRGPLRTIATEHEGRGRHC